MAKKPTTATNTALVAFGNKEVAATAKGFRVAKRVTVPLKLLQTGEQFEFTVDGEMSGGEQQHGRPGFDKSMVVCPVTDLSTGESVTLICSSVLESALRRAPGGYVGKSFAALQGPKMPGKRYFQIELFTLEAE